MKAELEEVRLSGSLTLEEVNLPREVATLSILI